MKLFEEFSLRFERKNWQNDVELALIDTILEQRPDLFLLLKDDIMQGLSPQTKLGRGDSPSVEQIVRAAFYKEIKGLDYRELEYAQMDSRICAEFIKIDQKRLYSFQVYQKYISKITAENLEKFMVEINKIAISEGLEDVKKIRMDSTVVKTNIHYPTNNSLLWDCIRESHRLLESLKNEIDGVEFRDYLKNAKKTYFKINNVKPKKNKKETSQDGEKNDDARVKLFKKQLVTFTKCINQVSNVLKKNVSCVDPKAIQILEALKLLKEKMKKVQYQSLEREINGNTVKNEDKIFSIFEEHTQIVVKGTRDVEFGHVVDMTGGNSNLVLTCEIHEKPKKDSTQFVPNIEKISTFYHKTPQSVATDGGYASLDNQTQAKKMGIVNIVFNKIVGSLKNIASSTSMETRLKKWRSGMEAVISNLKRGFNLSVCNWKGYEHFKAKVFWSIISYNIRVMSGLVLARC